MAKKAAQSACHRSTLKQSNKPFKGSKKKGSKEVKQVVVKSRVVEGKLARHNLNDQRRSLRKAKFKSEVEKEVEVGNPRLVAVVGLHESVEVIPFAEALIKFLAIQNVRANLLSQADADTIYADQMKKVASQQIVTVALPTWAGKTAKQLQLFFCQRTSVEDLSPEVAFEETLRILDVCKAADAVLTLFGDASLATPAFGSWGNELTSLLNKQGLPYVVGAATLTKKLLESENEPKKFRAANWDVVQRSFLTEFGKERPCFNLVDPMLRLHRGVDMNSSMPEMVKLVRKLCNATLPGLTWRERERGYLLSQVAEFDSASSTLALCGYVRGLSFNCKYPVHLTGIGDCRLERMSVFPVVPRAGENIDASKSIVVDTRPDSAQYEDLFEPFRREGTQSLTAEMDVEVEESEAEETNAEFDESVEGDIEEVDSQSDWMDDRTEADGPRVVLQPRSRNDMEFPDEVDTPNDMTCAQRFKKFRPLRNFKNSKWTDLQESPSPDYYKTIFEIRPFKETMAAISSLYKGELSLMSKRLAEACQSKQGQFVCLYLKLTSAEAAARVERQLHAAPFLVSSLSPVELKASINHFACMKFGDVQDVPIPHKSEFLMQCGFRRLPIRPLFSESRSSATLMPAAVREPSLHKLSAKRYLPNSDKAFAVATYCGPIQANRSDPIICWFGKLNPRFKEEVEEIVTRSAASEEPLREPARFMAVGHGHHLTSDPSRLILKRILLTGYPHKIKKKKCSVRRMFLTRSDVEHFAGIPLFTKRGREGKIKEALGTHGDMKCIFSDSIDHGDTICMPLYKRMYPPIYLPTFNPIL